MEFKKILINGLLIRYLEINKDARQSIIFLHGWGGSLDSWQNFLTTLEGENIRVLAFDLPGFGQSQTPPQAWTVSDYADLLRGFLDQLGLAKIWLFGHSFGGQIAVRFVHDHPERVAKLFLSGPAIIRPKKSFYKIIIGAFAKVIRILMFGKGARLRRFVYRLIGGADYGNLTDPAMRQTMKNVLADDLSGLLPGLKLPIFIIWGKQDKYTPYKNFLQIKKILPQAQTFIFEDGRHGLHWQKPAELKKIILNQLK